MKASKKKSAVHGRLFTLIGILFVILSAAIIYKYFSLQTTRKVNKLNKNAYMSTNPNFSVKNSNTVSYGLKSKASPGRQEYSISSNSKTIIIYKAVIDPEDVKVSQRQSMSISVRDAESDIVSVTAEIDTDHGTIKHPLLLRSGTKRDGVWQNEWTVRDTHDSTYITIFRVTTAKNETAKARLSWTDPGCGCSEAANSSCTIAGNCTVSGVEGADGTGTLTINSPAAITVPNGTYLNYGTTLVLNSGILAVNSGGVVKGGSICGSVPNGITCNPSGCPVYQCNGSGSCVQTGSLAVYFNDGSGTDCNGYCARYGRCCLSIGTDTNGTNMSYIQSYNWCPGAAGNCGTAMANTGGGGCGCSGNNQCTYCRCD